MTKRTRISIGISAIVFSIAAFIFTTIQRNRERKEQEELLRSIIHDQAQSLMKASTNAALDSAMSVLRDGETKTSQKGETADIGRYRITVLGMNPTVAAKGIFQPERGNKYVGLELECENSSADSLDLGLWMFRLIITDSTYTQPTFSVQEPGVELHRKLAPAEKRRGWLTYEVPKTILPEALEFREKMFGGDKLVITLSR